MTDCLSQKREQLTELLRSKLIECGWRDHVANMCRTLIQEQGVEQIKLEQIIRQVREKARQSVPEQVKLDLLEVIRRVEMQSPEDEQQPQEQPKPETEMISNLVEANLH